MPTGRPASAVSPTVKPRAMRRWTHRLFGLAFLGAALAACREDPSGPGTTPARIHGAHLSQLDPGAGQVSYSDVWGYSDAATGREYALIGTLGGSHIYVIDVTDPAAPSVVSSIFAPSFDFKTWGHYLYSVTGSGDGGANLGRIVDLSDPGAPVEVGTFPSSHNLTIDDQGFMYLETPGLRIFDLNADPLQPQRVYLDGSTGGHDATVIGNRLYDFHGGGTRIYDVSQRAAPQLLGPVAHPSISYYHNGWPSADGRYLFVTDELSQGNTADVTIWDITEVDDPVLVSTLSHPQATVHNVMIVGNAAYMSYYGAGFRVYDVTNPSNPALAYEYDTSSSSGEGWHGAFGVYPFAPRGLVYVSDMSNGLHVFSVTRQ